MNIFYVMGVILIVDYCWYFFLIGGIISVGFGELIEDGVL